MDTAAQHFLLHLKNLGDEFYFTFKDGAIYDTEANSWTLLPRNDETFNPKYGLDAFAVGSKVVFLGGKIYKARPNVGHTLVGGVFDLKSNSWLRQ